MPQHEHLTPEETELLAKLFSKATGLQLRIPTRDEIAISQNSPWITEFHAATAPHLRPMADFYRSYLINVSHAKTNLPHLKYGPYFYDSGAKYFDTTAYLSK